MTEGGSSPYTNSTVDYITKWVVGAKEHHGLTLDFIGSWNEHPTDKAYIVNLRKSLDAANFSSTRIIVAGHFALCIHLPTRPWHPSPVSC